MLSRNKRGTGAFLDCLAQYSLWFGCDVLSECLICVLLRSFLFRTLIDF